MTSPSPECPLYEKLRHAEDSCLFMITVDEGWRKNVLCSYLYERHADWLISLVQGKQYP